MRYPANHRWTPSYFPIRSLKSFSAILFSRNAVAPNDLPGSSCRSLPRREARSRSHVFDVTTTSSSMHSPTVREGILFLTEAAASLSCNDVSFGMGQGGSPEIRQVRGRQH